MLAMATGTIVIYTCGVGWLKILTGMTILQTLTVGMFPFLLGDLLKIGAALPIARILRPIVRNGQRGERRLTAAPIIEFQDVVYNYPDGTAGLDHFSLSIPGGEFVVIAGCNGSGKTTFLKHLNGLLLPQEGSVAVAGRPVADDLIAVRQQVGLVFQHADSQIVGETVFGDVAFGPENLCLEPAEIQLRVERALRAVGLLDAAHLRPHCLSGGEKRRLTIAGVLAMDPLVVALDEPFSDLDYPGVLQVLQQIVDLHRAGRTVIVTTHDLEKVVAHADRLILMANGRIACNGNPSELFPQTERFGVREPCASRFGKGLVSWLDG